MEVTEPLKDGVTVVVALDADDHRRLGRQRGAKVARIELARDLCTAIWHMLTNDEAFAPAGPAIHLVA